MPNMNPTTSTLLIVSGKPEDRKALEAILSPRGYHIVHASNQTQAFTDASVMTPDLILIDTRLPSGSGLETCQLLKKEPSLTTVPIVMMADFTENVTRRMCLEAGASDLIMMPYDQLELETLVNTFAQLSFYRGQYQEREKLQIQEERPKRGKTDPLILKRVITALSTKLDIDEVLRSACEVMAHLFALPQATAWQLDRGRMCFEIAAEYSLRGGTSPDPRGGDPGTFSSQLSTTGKTLHVKGIPWLERLVTQGRVVAGIQSQSDPNHIEFNDPTQENNIASMLIVPIQSNDLVSAFVELSHDTLYGFSKQDISLAESVAQTAGEAIEAINLYQRLHNYAEYLDQALAQRTLELETERDRTRSILEALGEAVFVTDMGGMILYVNQAAVTLTGYQKEALLGQRMRLWRSHRQTAELYTQMLTNIYDGKTWRGEVINERKDGALYDAAMTIAPLFAPRDPENPIGFVSVQRDITPVKQAERMKDQFVSNVSHELRTPLSVITLLSGNLDALYAEMSDDKRQKLIRDIRGHTQVLNELISSVLEISRIDSRQVSKDDQPLDLVQLVREEVDKQQPLAQSESQVLKVIGVEHLPIRGTASQLRQVIRNLINNAIKYTPQKGAITCECQIHTNGAPTHSVWPGSEQLPPGHWAAFRVVDSGIGIDAKHIPHLFERFYRVKSQGNIPGAGLGLSIAKELVNLHAGHIAATSTPGVGSTFAVYLPLLEE